MLHGSLSYVLFLCCSYVSSHLTLEIDNGLVAEPEVQCGSDSISLFFHTRNPFGGKVFVKGFVSDEDCIMMGDNKLDHRFTVKHDGCGVRRQREVNGVVIISTVIVSFHPIFITKVDRAYRLSCFYVEGTKKVQQQLDIAALTTQVVEGQTQLPVCRYDILSDGPNGIPVKYGKVGEMVYHKWTCVSELTDVYCMRVHSCTVYDGQGGPPVTVLDVNGCSVDGVILQNLDYLDDLTAGKSAQVFKFADKAGLYFNCQIRLTIKDKQLGCSAAVPQCGQTYVQSSQQTTEIATEYTNSASYESGYPTRASVESAAGGYVTTQPPGYESEEQRYPEPAPFNVQPGYAKLDVGSTSRAPNVVGAPGIRPTYKDLHPNQTETGAPTNYNDQSAYTRLIKRNIKAAVLQNRTQPVAIADFDLPERSLIVFGLEDANGEDQDHESTSHLVLQERASKMCFTTQKMLLTSTMGVTLVVALIISLSLVVYKQRKVISQSTYLKH